MSTGRREARERALELLYEAEAKSLDGAGVLAQLLVDPDPYATTLLVGIDARKDEVDALISRYARDWTLERMPWVDRNVLRIGVYELLARPDIPTGVAISEALEVAKRFSGPEAGRFVNGMLVAIAKELRPGTATAPPTPVPPAPPEEVVEHDPQPEGEPLKP